MKQINMFVLAGCFLFAIVIAGCGSGPVVVNKEASTSSISAAEAVGASNIPSASLYLQLAKEELAKADVFAKNGDKEQADSMLLRAQADGELAVALSHSDTYKKEAKEAIERVQKLQQDNQIPQERN